MKNKTKVSKTVPSLRDLVVQLQRFCYRHQVLLEAYDTRGDGKLCLRSVSGDSEFIVFTIREVDDGSAMAWDSRASFAATVMVSDRLPVVGPLKKPVLKKCGPDNLDEVD